jgi:hypothetical protein
LTPARDDPAADARQEDAGELQGEWEVVSAVIDGNDQSPLFRGRPLDVLRPVGVLARRD